MNKKMNKLLILTMISIFVLTAPIMVEAGIPTPPESKQYDLIVYDYEITNEDGKVIDDQYDLIVNLTFEEDWHYYLEGRKVGESSAYKDKDDNIHTFYIMDIIPYQGDAISEPDPSPDIVTIFLGFITGLTTGFTIEEVVLLLIIIVVGIWLLSHLRM